jgi:hypothetical protein
MYPVHFFNAHLSLALARIRIRTTIGSVLRAYLSTVDILQEILESEVKKLETVAVACLAAYFAH